MAVGRPIANALECLEATASNPADVYLYWLAILAHMKETLKIAMLPDEVNGQIQGIMTRQFNEFFYFWANKCILMCFLS